MYPFGEWPVENLLIPQACQTSGGFLDLIHRLFKNRQRGRAKVSCGKFGMYCGWTFFPSLLNYVYEMKKEFVDPCLKPLTWLPQN